MTVSTEKNRSWWRRYLAFPLIYKLGIALVLGAVVGLLVGPDIAVVKPLGTVFLRLLQMMVVPVVVFTLVAGVSSGSAGQFGRVGVKIMVYYTLTTMVAITLGLALASLFQPGAGLTLPEGTESAPKEAPPLNEVLMNIVPTNPISAMVEGDMLAVLFFALVFGLALGVLRSSEDERLAGLGENMRRFFEAGAEVTFVAIRGILEYAPIGVFALLAVTLGETGMDALAPLAVLTATVYGGVAVQILLYCLILLVFGHSVRGFFAAAKEPMLMSFVTRSSSGTLPVSMRAAEKMGVDEGVYGFTLPLGATINMDGTAVYVGAAVIFVANVAGVHLSLTELISVALVGVLASVGTAGVPGAGLIMLSLAITQAGLPFGPVALVAGIDALLDMVRSMCNVTGDLAGTRIVDGGARRRRRVFPARQRDGIAAAGEGSTASASAH
ncbi:dicarboxylate/amino acid:cation symporter [Kocuria sp. KD4]|nr:dicarboxylate/amino acid:cation symporter [Kocuria sp. KD4]